MKASAVQAARADQATYRAFISYSHSDEAVASRLHRWLETYRIPHRLVGEETGRGTVTRRLAPIFRDRLELPAASDLNAEVKQALAASEALLVLCSPAARASKWVGAEISLFQALHPDRPVIAALLSGEPDESFPEGLVQPPGSAGGREPIAADFRKNGDGTKLARLKIVAGLTGLALDKLIQREAQRQLRRVIAVTLVTLLFALSMALMLTYAVRAQREAEYQRSQAEGLIEFMLTDLRSKLKGVGRLDVLQSVNERALAYYGKQADLTALSVDSLERRARILHAMGEDDHRRGDLGAAIGKFREAHRVTAALLASAPGDPLRIFAHAQSEFWLGYVDVMRKRPEAALPRFIAYRALARDLVGKEPANLDYRRELAYAEGNICTVAVMRKGPSRDLSECHTALQTMAQVAQGRPNDPDSLSDLANRYAWWADALKLLGRKEEALTARRHQSAIIDDLLKQDPRNADYLQDWMLARYSTSELLSALGQKDEAETLRKDALAMSTRLIAADPDNNDWQVWRDKLAKSVNE